MSADLTAILLPAPPRGPNPNDVLSVVAQNAPPALWVRLAPLVKHGVQQLEILDGQSGLPSVAPDLVSALSRGDGKAMFLHVNHQAKQVLLHAFEDGVEVATYSGEPNEAFDQELQRLLGCSVDDLVADDDGTRLGFGQAASRTAALVRGRLLLVPAGTPTGLGSFGFHDRGHDLRRPGEGDADDDEDERDNTRVAFFAYDHDLITRAWKELPGKQLAQVISSAPVEVLGPLFPLRDETAKVLEALGDEPAGKLVRHSLVHVRAFEMLALAHAGIYAGGDALSYLDERLLPLLSIGDATPVIDDEDEAQELEQQPSILSAMVEVLPFPKPPGGYGQILEQLGPAELTALAPWAKAGQEYEGVIFRVVPDRMLELVRSLDGNKLAARLDGFGRALFEAGPGKGQGDEAYQAWFNKVQERSGPDLERFLTGWAELRIALEVTSLNQMALGLIVYGG